MTALVADFLLKRIDRPLAWVKVFGVCLMVAVVGYRQNGVNGAFEGAIQGLIAGVMTGLLFGGVSSEGWTAPAAAQPVGVAPAVHTL